MISNIKETREVGKPNSNDEDEDGMMLYKYYADFVPKNESEVQEWLEYYVKSMQGQIYTLSMRAGLAKIQYKIFEVFDKDIVKQWTENRGINSLESFEKYVKSIYKKVNKGSNITQKRKATRKKFEEEQEAYNMKMIEIMALKAYAQDQAYMKYEGMRRTAKNRATRLSTLQKALNV